MTTGKRRAAFAFGMALGCLLAALPFLSGCCRERYCCRDRTPVRVYGSRTVLNPAAKWGGKISLQDPWIAEAMNGFFKEYAGRLGLPEDLRVYCHPDGASLLYGWTDESGLPKLMTQTARPSLWFNLTTLNGRLAEAQERDWGFVVTPRFARARRENRAVTTLHEFWHQYMQIKRCGVVRYWLAYAGEFVTKGYSAMCIEKEAYAVNDLFEKYIEERYGIVFRKRKAGHTCPR